MESYHNHIGTRDKADDYQKGNEFIHSGYRIKFNSTAKIIKSLFMLHNESVNVWSHLLGVLLFMVFIWHATIAIGLNTSPN